MTKSVTVTFLFRLEGLKLNDTDWINDFKEKRTQYGVSQNRLAVMASISREYVSRIESGKVALTEEIKGKFTDALEKLNPENPLESGLGITSESDSPHRTFGTLLKIFCN